MPAAEPGRPGPKLDPQNPTPDLLLWAYRQGVFPMADPSTGLMEWFSPDPRGVLPLDRFVVPRTLARVVRRGDFEIASDRDFEAVMRECARPRGPDGDTWIDERLIAAYRGLHDAGFAHSVEAWSGGALVGGLYGVHIGAAFFGESMFVRPDRGGSNASKICLVHLVEHMRDRGFTLLDTQFTNEHLDQFGCTEVPRTEYRRLLADAVGRPVTWGEFGAA